MRGVLARGEYPAHGIPKFLDTVQGRKHHESGPLPPFELGLGSAGQSSLGPPLLISSSLEGRLNKVHVKVGTQKLQP